MSTRCAVQSAMKLALVPLPSRSEQQQICASKDATVPTIQPSIRINASGVRNVRVRCARRLTNRESKCQMIATLGQFCVVSQHPLVLRVWCSFPLGLNKNNYFVPFHDCYDLSKPTWVPKLLRRSCEEFFREMKWGE